MMITNDHDDAVALVPSCYKPGGALDGGYRSKRRINRQSVIPPRGPNKHGLVQLALLAVYLEGVKIHGIITVGILVKNVLQGFVSHISRIITPLNVPRVVRIQPGRVEIFSKGLYLRNREEERGVRKGYRSVG